MYISSCRYYFCTDSPDYSGS
uniref:Uncharacterized protein n=1 Tax=Rhizophora mucronata TaxID=61149 RepID=A0A2P2QYW2_RHIMU